MLYVNYDRKCSVSWIIYKPGQSGKQSADVPGQNHCSINQASSLLKETIIKSQCNCNEIYIDKTRVNETKHNLCKKDY